MLRTDINYSFDFNNKFYLFLSASNSLLGKTIKWFTKSRFNHAGVIVGKLGQELIISEAITSGVDLNPISTYNKAGSMYEIHELDCDPRLTQDMIQMLLLKENHKYGKGQLVTFSYVQVMKNWFKKSVKNPITKGTICSELASLAGMFCQAPTILKVTNKLDVNCISPDDLGDAVDADNGTTSRLIFIKPFDVVLD